MIPPFDVTFNREVALDLMCIDGKAALHVVDLETHFIPASFLKHQTVASLYIGYPEKMRVDK